LGRISLTSLGARGIQATVVGCMFFFYDLNDPLITLLIFMRIHIFISNLLFLTPSLSFYSSKATCLS